MLGLHGRAGAAAICCEHLVPTWCLPGWPLCHMHGVRVCVTGPQEMLATWATMLPACMAKWGLDRGKVCVPAALLGAAPACCVLAVWSAVT